MADWTEKYRPSTLSEVRGNDKARDAFAEWARSWDDHREAVVLHGSPGVGKTSAAHALANDMGWETVELNASDQRTADVIERFAGRAARNATLGGSAAGGGAAGGDTASRQLVVLDEADNIHGNYDRGGASAITKLVKESGQPIVLIANDYYDMSRGLRNATQEIEFRDVSARSIVPVLRDVCRKEGIEFESDALQRIAEGNRGDLRGAINDLQAATQGRDSVTVEDVVTGDRDKALGLFPFLDAVLKEESAEEALQSAYAVDETPDDISRWIENNVLDVYEPAEAVRAYDFLANADVWLGRVRATQNYSYWRYATDNAAAGVAAARDGEKGGWTRYGRPQFWSSSDATADEVVGKIAAASGCSVATARREVLPFLEAVTHHCKPRELTVAMAAAYDLDEAGVAFVTGSGESTNKVASIVEDAQARREELIEEHADGAFAVDGARRGDEGDAAADRDGDGSGSTDPESDPADSGEEPADDESPNESDDDQAGLTDFM
ncbi:MULTISPECIES: replication factor C large subunit [unclassified Halorubrum]|uniref:replication factor C large subunit n=1 Tax=unclassified Halorubrum TaxID=2642239 RepID=UPI0010F5308F|nr:MULTISPECIES: replication factor C large subunit [unclassified Halorubrum]TKX45229.1 replication factor C large subunit [Halorubrum sp. ARQ200]TKX51597.1 replication factor C large subunit [Halorubrum sp. ASP121]TKX61186.1 replication factor C large subunit [Halorubrum sp. ASP1]